MQDRILITGAGMVSAIGIGMGETLRSLLDGRTGIAPVKYLHTGRTEFPVGEVKLTNARMKTMLGFREDAVVTRTALLGMLALGEALERAGLDREMLSEAVLVNGTTVGGMDCSELRYRDFINPDTNASSEYIAVHDCGATTDAIADRFGRFAMTTTLSTACSSAANAAILGAGLIRSGRADIVVVGGAESLSDFHLNGFASLMILDTAQCRPFDSTRAGLNLGEGAAFLVLESENSARRRGADPMAELAGWGNACDAFHQTASSPDGEGAYLAMKKALSMAGMGPGAVDYVNAHGTGTPNNDSSESAALRRVFGNNMPPVSSTKSFTGHTTSASGSVEAVICLLAMEYGFIPPNLGWTSRDADCISPSADPDRPAELNCVLCNSFGFGGNDSSLLIRKI